MKEIDKIRTYVQRTGIEKHRSALYDMRCSMVNYLADNLGPRAAVTWAFVYGRAKGYRMAMAERGINHDRTNADH